MKRTAYFGLCAILLLLCTVSCARFAPIVRSEAPTVAIPQLPSNFVEIDGTKIHYYEMGEGEPLILLHGMMGSGLSWFQNIPHFAKDYHVYAFDFPGLGKSELGNFKSNIKEYTRFLRLFIEKKNLEKPSLVGISLGGHVSMNYALQYPDEIDRLVLISPTGIRKPIGPIEQLAWITLWHQIPLQWHFTPKRVKDLWNKQYQHSFDVREALYLKRSEFHDHEGIKDYLRIFQPCVYDIKHYSLRNKLDQIQMPTLIIWGLHNKYHPASEGDFLNKKIKNSQLVKLPSGPPVNVDMPKEFNQIASKFLNASKQVRWTFKKDHPQGNLN